jgi:hypothetical protein
MYTRLEKEPVVQKEDKAVDVVVTRLLHLLFLIVLSIQVCTSQAAILPEDRSDLLYHSYDGGGVEIDGPSLLVRKQAGKSFSVFGNYYVDSVSSASIDVVVSGASRYSEKRTETSLGVDYLHDKTNMSLAYTLSDENDYTANSLHVGISQEVFGGLTTISMGYSLGQDEVRKREATGIVKVGDIDRQNYRVGISQVLTKNWLAEASFETITDEGFLNNPYRSVRYIDGATYTFQAEQYPNTRTSNALALRTRYYLPYRAAIHGEYRFYTDSWGINANTFEIGYTHPLKKHWILDFKFRHYNQNHADFYNDLFPYVNAQNFLARDKELSTFSSNTLGFGVSYKLKKGKFGFIDRGTLNLNYDFIQFDYDDFRDLTKGGTIGQEPLYSFNANVIQLFLSVWY